jgi:hypothetical protein
LKNEYFGALLFQEIKNFEHLIYNLELHDPKKFKFSKFYSLQKWFLFQWLKNASNQLRVWGISEPSQIRFAFLGIWPHTYPP